MTNKKNRFAMLEVESPAKVDTKQSASTTEKLPTSKEKPRNFAKVIIEDDEFENNLRQHKLINQQKEIPHQKKEIESKILRLKKEAWIKIGIGVLIIVFSFKKFFLNDFAIKHIGYDEEELVITHHKLANNDYFLIASIVIFIIYIFKTKKKKD
jgi:hypothetical protein